MRYFTEKLKRSLGIYVLSFFVIASLAGCQGGGIFYSGEEHPAYVVKEQTGPPPWAPAYGWRAKHQYYYYPSVGVYFDIGREVYFYFNGSRWVVAARLPKGVTISINERVFLEMDTSRPYLYYPNHVKKYPPGQLKKKIKPQSTSKTLM